MNRRRDESRLYKGGTLKTIEMKKRTIRVKGKELPCRVTMGALLRFKHLTGMEVSELKDSDVEGVLMFVYCCVASACNADGVELGMDAETFADCLEPGELQAFTADRIRRKKAAAGVQA